MQITRGQVFDHIFSAIHLVQRIPVSVILFDDLVKDLVQFVKVALLPTPLAIASAGGRARSAIPILISPSWIIKAERIEPVSEERSVLRKPRLKRSLVKPLLESADIFFPNAMAEDSRQTPAGLLQVTSTGSSILIKVN